MTPHTGRTRTAVALVLAATLLTGCAADDSLAQQYREGDEKGYIAGDFQVVEIPEPERGDPVVFEVGCVKLRRRSLCGFQAAVAVWA
ncbi:hypothetical protein [Microbacterium lacticum]